MTTLLVRALLYFSHCDGHFDAFLTNYSINSLRKFAPETFKIHWVPMEWLHSNAKFIIMIMTIVIIKTPVMYCDAINTVFYNVCFRGRAGFSGRSLPHSMMNTLNLKQYIFKRQNHLYSKFTQKKLGQIVIWNKIIHVEPRASHRLRIIQCNVLTMSR